MREDFSSFLFCVFCASSRLLAIREALSRPGEADEMTFWIREVADHKICPRVPFGAQPAHPAEALGFTERGLDVRNADVKDHVPVVVDASPNPTRDPRPIAGGVAVSNP